MPTLRRASLVSLFGLVLAACGGGGGPAGTAGSSAPGFPPPAPAPGPAPGADAQRVAAATATAERHPLCTAIRPFYWEVGDRGAALASASLGTGAPGATTGMAVGEASLWVWASYVAQLRSGAPTAVDVQFLTHHSGFTGLVRGSCNASATVGTCLALGGNGVQDAAAVDRFVFNGGHAQRHAVDLALGGLGGAALAAEVQGRIGSFGLAYASPEVATGLFASAADYGAFLRAILAGGLSMSGLLGSGAVCTNPSSCASAPAAPPVPATESWHYALGHWVEDDPAVGDGAFSSFGAAGFYPWIDAGRTSYGVVARESSAADAGFASVRCGRLIRRAWATGVEQ